MTTPELTPTLREALDKALGVVGDNDFFSDDEYEALAALRDACPEQPTRPDGRYEVPEEDGDYRMLYVRDGRYAVLRNPDGSLRYSMPLPADVSGWRRIDGPPTITAEQIDEVARVTGGYSERVWAKVGESTKDTRRWIARSILTAAGIEVTR